MKRAIGENIPFYLNDQMHLKKKWVRLTRVCNNNCLFCLDSAEIDGANIPRERIREELSNGIAEGAEQAVFSGGEPTLHPDVVGLIADAVNSGYKRVQLISNGRMFSYSGFLDKCLESGLNEITFAIHGHTPEIGDMQAGVKGAFEQSLRGLVNALSRKNLVVSMNIVINRLNVEYFHLIMKTMIALGVREFDVQFPIPFGRAWENRENIFFDIVKAQPDIHKALKVADIPGVRVWTNRMPPPALENLEHLIQRPIKLVDEVQERKAAFDGLLLTGKGMICRGERCQYCRMNSLCIFFSKVRKQLKERDYGWLLLRESGLDILKLIEAPECSGIIVDDARLLGDRRVERFLLSRNENIKVICRNLREAETLLNSSRGAGLQLEIELNAETAEQISKKGLPDIDGISIALPNRATADACFLSDSPIGESMRRLKMSKFRTWAKLPIVNVPPCLMDKGTFISLDRIPIDVAFSPNLDSVLIAEYFVQFGDYHKSFRCSGCLHEHKCSGLHINHARCFGFAQIPGPIVSYQP